MRTVSVRVEDLKKIVIPIGFVGENLHTKVIIDSTKVFADYPDAIATMTVQPAAGAAYPAVVVRNGNAVEWDVSDSDLVNVGRGEIQLSFTVDEVIAKSYIGTVRVERSILPAGEVPEPIDDWMNRAETALSEIDGLTASAETLAAGSSATAEISIVEGHKNIALGIPKGDKGDRGTDGRDGQDGHSPVVTASKSGKVTTVSVDGTAIATINDGNDGQDGQDGFSPSASVSKSGSVATISITDKDGTTTATVTDGQDGETGATPVISIGTVSTLTPGSDATASMDTTDPAHPVLSLGIPEGEPGEVTEAELFDATHGRWNEDNEPYLFRASGGDASVYEWEKDTLVGGTVAWNQLANILVTSQSKTENNVTYVDNRDGTYTVSTTAEGASELTYFSLGGLNVISGHKYMMRSCPPGGSMSTYRSYMSSNMGVGVRNMNDTGNGVIYNATGTGLSYFVAIYISSGTIISTPVVFKPQLFDLTQMFGSTIADYIYTLEQGTAGAGIAWLKKHGFMTKPYYAYDAGTLMSGKAEAHKTVGFNQWDEEWELGVYDINTGAKVNNTSNIRNKNLIRVLPNTSYCWRNTSSDVIRFVFFDANENYVSYISTSKSDDKYTFTTPANAYFFAFYYSSTTYSNNVCINLSSSRNGEYEPYTSHTYALGSDELRGLFMLDSNNKLYCNGDTKTSDGTINRRYMLVDLGTLDWSSGFNGYYNTSLSVKLQAINTIPNLICAKFQTIAYTDESASIPSITIVRKQDGYSYNGYLVVKGTDYADAATFKTAMSGVYLVYELATPTTESADPFTNPQAVSPYGTEEYTDSRAVPIPVGHETKYLMNPYQYVEELTKPTEDDMVANNNITSGSFFIIGNRLFKASSAIASGSAIIPGSNCVETNLAEALNTLQ